MIALANLLNQLSAADRAFVAEAERTLSVSGLSMADARAVLSLSRLLGWGDKAFDGEGTEWGADELPPEFAPFRIPLQKPDAPDGELLLISVPGFLHWLREGHPAVKWRVAPLQTVIRTHGRIFLPLDMVADFAPSPRTKSPRSMVREHGAQRLAPDDIRPWLLSSEDLPLGEDPVASLWANVAFKELLKSLPDEVCQDSPALKFKGPPRLTLPLPVPDIDFLVDENRKCFSGLQRAANWVYENERETELRHILLATELARSGDAQSGAFECIKMHISDALDGAKVAYQMSLSDLGRDTLKVLADLRKAITEETAKVTEATRQLVAAIAGSIAIGLGLIAARLTTNTASWLIVAVMLVVASYVAVVIFSGDRFIRLQRQLRKDWQPRLYRFLPQEEYQRMVETPAKQAERTFWGVAIFGGGAVTILTLSVLFNMSYGMSNNSQSSIKRDPSIESSGKVLVPVTHENGATPLQPNSALPVSEEAAKSSASKSADKAPDAPSNEKGPGETKKGIKPAAG